MEAISSKSINEAALNNSKQTLYLERPQIAFFSLAMNTNSCVAQACNSLSKLERALTMLLILACAVSVKSRSHLQD